MAAQYLTKPTPVVAWQYSNDNQQSLAKGAPNALAESALPDPECTIVNAYKLANGTIVGESEARSKSYPLGLQPVVCQAIVSAEGSLVELTDGSWIVKLAPRSFAVYSDDDFTATFVADESK